MDTAFFPNAGITYLPGKGNYSLEFPWGPYPDTLITIRDTGLFVFKYKEPKIGLYSGGMDQPAVYRKCDTLINGYDEDFYANGNIRIRGTFVKGRPKDSLVLFYQNGRAKERRLYLPKETYVEEFDSLSNPARVTHYKKGYRYNDGYYKEHSKTMAFFPNGKLKLIEFQFGDLVLIKEFYPSGQLKIRQTRKRRIEYYENGLKKTAYTWKHYFDKDVPPDKGRKDFTVCKTAHDENGQILLSAVYTDWNSAGLQPELDINKSDWIDSLTKYKGGKQIFAVKDMDPKEYFKKYPAIEGE
jgi:antitoxin component YwqK of YwqJK toxin-antitoxin module